MGNHSADDNSFGPQYGTSFDFTLLFESIIFTIIPTVLFIGASPFHILHYQSKPTVAARNGLLWSKVGVAFALLCLDITMSVVWGYVPDLQSRATTASTSLSCLAAFCVGLMIVLEHRRSTQSSVMLSIYLSLMVVADGVKTRSYLLRPGLHLVGAFSCAVAIVKLVLLILQEVPKHIKTKPNKKKEKVDDDLSPEATGGFWNRTLALWVNSTLFFGFRGVLKLETLAALGPDFASKQLSERFDPPWEKADKTSKYCLLKTWLSVLAYPFLLPAIPRTCLTIFSFCFPPLMRQILTFLGLDQDAQDATPTSTKVGYVLSFALVYLGITISRTSHKHLMNRHATMLRGLFVSQISKKNLRLKLSAAQQSSALTLMSTDIDGINTNIESFHSTWIAFPEFGLALFFLYRLIGVSFVLPIIPITISVFASNYLMKKMEPATELWNEAIETRVAKMVLTLAQMKPVKMLGLETVMTKYIQGLREEELRCSLAARKVDIIRRSLFPLAYGFTPLVTFAGALFWTTLRDGLNSVVIFEIMAYIYLIYDPLYAVLNSWIDMGTALGCFSRLQGFLLLEEAEENRIVKEFLAHQEAVLAEKRVGRVYTVTETQPRELVVDIPIISFIDVTVISDITGKRVLSHLNMTVGRGTLAMVTGPVASGKSTFLRTALGNTTVTEGSIHIEAGSVAYCDQKTWLPNLTIQEAIVGECEFDAVWYREVVSSCALDHDIEKLPQGDQTRIGSNGAAISGGQKQRVAAARALYSRAPLMIADDILSALDFQTAHHAFTRVFGPDGLLKKHGRTAILATHSVEFLSQADQVLILDKNGNMTVETPDSVGSYITHVNMLPKSERPIRGDDSDTCRGPIQEVEDMERALEMSPRVGDWSLYPFFLKPISKRRLSLFLFLISLVGMLERMVEIYMRVWVDVDPKSKYLFFGLIGIAFGAVFINYAAAWVYMIQIVPVIANSLHEMFLHSVMGATLPFLTSTGTGVLLNRSSQDMTDLSQGLPMAFYRVIYLLSSVLTDTVVIAAGAKYAAVMIPIMLVILFVVQLIYLRTSRQMRYLDLEAKTPLYTRITETADGLEHIRSFGWETKVFEKTLVLLDQSQKPFYYLLSIQRWLVLVLDLNVTAIGTMLVFIAVMWPTTASQPSLGLALIGTLGYSHAVTYLTNQWTTLETSLGAVARLRTFVKYTPTERDASDAIEQAPDFPRQGNVQFSNISARYSAKGRPQMALEDVNLTAYAGEVVALTGRTGSGKSSLLLTLLNFVKYTGTIMIDGVDISTIPRAQLRQIITTIPQEAVDIPGTVYDSLLPFELLGGSERPEGLSVMRMLKAVGLLDHVEARGGIHQPVELMEFSAGQRQLLGLARAMLHHEKNNTKIVLMDEAISNVDEDTAKKIQQVMCKVFKNCTMLVVAHKSILKSDCDKEVEFEDGKLVRLVGQATSLARREEDELLRNRRTVHARE